jgi:hypothetical protein
MRGWYLNIPKKFHVFWSGNKLPYLRYLTVKTFKELNPSWEINLWTSQVKSEVRTWNTHELNYSETWEDWTDRLWKLCDNIHMIDFTNFGVKNSVAEVHKSDLLRCWILNEVGGVYSDTDIFYFKPITNLEVNRRKNKYAETFVCICHYGHSNGFWMGSKGSRFFGELFEQSKKIDPARYQSNGPELCNRMFRTIESINEISPAVNIGMEAVYYYNGQHVDAIYSEERVIFDKKSIGIHWYAGHPLSGMFLNRTNGGLTNLQNSIMDKLCKL